MDTELIQLRKERDQLLRENEQLWEVVYKQRDLLINLNKDIPLPERIYKDGLQRNAESEGMIDTELFLKAKLDFSELSKPVETHSFSYQEDTFIDRYLEPVGMEKTESPEKEIQPPLTAQVEPGQNAPTVEEQKNENVPESVDILDKVIAEKEVQSKLEAQAFIPDRNQSMVNIHRQTSNKEPHTTRMIPTSSSQTSLSEPAKQFVVSSTNQLEITTARIRKIETTQGAYLKFVFRVKSDQKVICYIEKSAIDCHQLEKRFVSDQPNYSQLISRLPELSEFQPQSSTSKQHGNNLQAWMMSIIKNFPDHPFLLEFISTNQCPAPVMKESFRKAGYLTKRGNYFGGWKSRYYSIDSNASRVYYADARHGEVLGSISLEYAYVAPYVPGNQQSKKDSDSTDRPGFVVTEYKKSMFNGPISFDQKNADGLPIGKVDFRHVFYAETVQERDSWVRCLSGLVCKLRPEDHIAKSLFAQTVAPNAEDSTPSSPQEPLSRSTSRQSVNSQLSIRYEDTANDVSQAAEEWKKIQKSSSFGRAPEVQTNQPAVSQGNPNLAPQGNHLSGETQDMKFAVVNGRMVPNVRIPDTVTTPSSVHSAQSSSTMTPVSASASKGLEAVSSLPLAEEGIATRRPRPVGMQGSPSTDVPKMQSRFVDDQTRCMQQPDPPLLVEELPLGVSPTKVQPEGKRKGNIFKDWMKRQNSDTHKLVRPIFGVTLQEAVQSSRIKEGIEIPAIVYRCIEYLDAKKGYTEEGLYRLSGASSVISSLKTRFEEEGDVPLLDSDIYYDPHAIAGLLKLFFRELAEPLFSQELRTELFHTSELSDRTVKINNMVSLVSKLPVSNYTCLRVLLGHLLAVVKYSDKNKMTARNISIVFSPTLGIPAGLFTLMLAEYSTVFGWKCHDLSRIPTKERKLITQEQIHQAIQEKIESANQSASNTPTKLIPPEDLIPGEFSRDTQRHSESKSPLSPSDTSEISPQPVQLDLTPDSQLLLKPVRVMDEPLGSLLTSSSLQAKSSNRYSEATGDMMMALAEQLKDLGNDHGYVGEEEANAQLLEDMVKELL